MERILETKKNCFGRQRIVSMKNSSIGHGIVTKIENRKMNPKEAVQGEEFSYPMKKFEKTFPEMKISWKDGISTSRWW
jgi:hypothetical protein